MVVIATNQGVIVFMASAFSAGTLLARCDARTSVWAQGQPVLERLRTRSENVTQAQLARTSNARVKRASRRGLVL